MLSSCVEFYHSPCEYERVLINRFSRATMSLLNSRVASDFCNASSHARAFSVGSSAI